MAREETTTVMWVCDRCGARISAPMTCDVALKGGWGADVYFFAPGECECIDLCRVCFVDLLNETIASIE